MSETDTTTVECPTCGNELEHTEGEVTVCYGTPPEPPHDKTKVAYPCAICGGTIQTAEMCKDCGEKTDGDAVTPTWGKHRYTDN